VFGLKFRKNLLGKGLISSLKQHKIAKWFGAVNSRPIVFRSQTSGPQTGTSHLSGFHLNKKIKFAMVIAVIAIMLVSILAFIPKSTPVVEPPIVDPTSTPAPSATATATQSPTPRPTNRNPVSAIQSIFQNIVVPASIIPKDPGVIESAQTMNGTVWKQVAAHAWAAFQPF
jgi:hypothetical protein